MDADTTRAVKDCWNTIGVHGDHSCAELVAHVHCRNCPTFSRGAKQLLDNLPSGDYVAEWTSYYARPKPVVDRNVDSLMIFRVESEWLALPIRVVDEISSGRSIHSLPHRRNAAVLGLTNIRGTLLACVSLARLLRLNQSKESPAVANQSKPNRLVVVRRENSRVVYAIDEVHGIHRVHENELRDVPTTVARAATCTRSVLVWRGRTVGVLDERLLFEAVQQSVA
jgi:chemotaxis-related protein WspD